MEAILGIGYIIFLAVMVAGFCAGLLLRDRPKAVGRVERLAKPVIFLLLFVMGVNIGLDEHTMGNLLTVGLSSLGFAVLTSAGSMLLLALVLPLAGRGFGRVSAQEAAVIKAEAIHEGEVLAK